MIGTILTVDLVVTETAIGPVFSASCFDEVTALEAVEFVLSRSAIKLIAFGTARDRVFAFLPDQLVLAFLTEQNVVSVGAANLVISVLAADHVVPAPSVDDVVPASSVYDVVAGRTEDQIGSWCAEDRRDQQIAAVQRRRFRLRDLCDRRSGEGPEGPKCKHTCEEFLQHGRSFPVVDWTRPTLRIKAASQLAGNP